MFENMILDWISCNGFRFSRKLLNVKSYIDALDASLVLLLIEQLKWIGRDQIHTITI